MIHVRAYAKINLMLDICGALPNGYHSLFMIMQSLSLYDRVSLEAVEHGITVSCSVPTIPCNEKNTAYKAAKAFLEKAGIDSGISIAIEKNIPHEAGLAGGSADAAAVIYGLNRLFPGKLSRNELMAVGLSVGADVPFCLAGGTCAVQDMGEVIAPLAPLEGCCFVLCKPNYGVSTASAYGAYDSAQGIRHLDRVAMLHACALGDRDKALSLCDNVFEQVIDVPDRAAIKAVLRKHGAKACCMSGSGPTVFGAFLNQKDAEACARELSKTYRQTFVCEPVLTGCEEE